VSLGPNCCQIAFELSRTSSLEARGCSTRELTCTRLIVTTYSLPTMPVEVLPNVLVEELSETFPVVINRAEIPNCKDTNIADAKS
jgi:hypothetical protein